MEKRWMLKNKPDKEVVEQLSRKLNINNKLTELLVHRVLQLTMKLNPFFAHNYPVY